MSGQTGSHMKGARRYWALRIVESTLLVVSLAGIGLFAWSIVDIVRIESAAGTAAASALPALPAGAWPGIFIFFGSMVALQVVRVFLHRFRRDDGSPRGGGRDAAAVTAGVLASMPASAQPGPADDAPDA